MHRCNRWTGRSGVAQWWDDSRRWSWIADLLYDEQTDDKVRMHSKGVGRPVDIVDLVG